MGKLFLWKNYLVKSTFIPSCRSFPLQLIGWRVCWIAANAFQPGNCLQIGCCDDLWWVAGCQSLNAAPRKWSYVQALNWRMLPVYRRWLIQSVCQIHEGYWGLVVIWVIFCVIPGLNKPRGWALWVAVLDEDGAKDNTCACAAAQNGGYGKSEERCSWRTKWYLKDGIWNFTNKLAIVWQQARKDGVLGEQKPCLTYPRESWMSPCAASGSLCGHCPSQGPPGGKRASLGPSPSLLHSSSLSHLILKAPHYMDHPVWAAASCTGSSKRATARPLQWATGSGLRANLCTVVEP